MDGDLSSLLHSQDALEAGSLTATASGLLLSKDGYLAIDYSSNVPFAAYVDGEIDPHDDGGDWRWLPIRAAALTVAKATMQIFPQNLDAVYGIGGPTGPWQIGSASPRAFVLGPCRG